MDNAVQGPTPYLHLVVVDAVVLGKDDFHLVPLVLHSAAQRGDHIAQTAHLQAGGRSERMWVGVWLEERKASSCAANTERRQQASKAALIQAAGHVVATTGKTERVHSRGRHPTLRRLARCFAATHSSHGSLTSSHAMLRRAALRCTHLCDGSHLSGDVHHAQRGHAAGAALHRNVVVQPLVVVEKARLHGTVELWRQSQGGRQPTECNAIRGACGTRKQRRRAARRRARPCADWPAPTQHTTLCTARFDRQSSMWRVRGGTSERTLTRTSLLSRNAISRPKLFVSNYPV